MIAETPRGHTTHDVSLRYRVGEDTIRGWIGKGDLAAINTAKNLCGKPRWVITDQALAEFEKRRSSKPAPRPERRKRTVGIDHYPD